VVMRTLEEVGQYSRITTKGTITGNLLMSTTFPGASWILWERESRLDTEQPGGSWEPRHEPVLPFRGRLGMVTCEIRTSTALADGCFLWSERSGELLHVHVQQDSAVSCSPSGMGTWYFD
jgi:hypothetical protein